MEDGNFFFPPVPYYLPFRDDLVGEYHCLPFVRSGSVPEEAEKVQPVLQILPLEASVCPEERFDAAVEVVDLLHRILRVGKPLRGAARIADPLASHRLDQLVIGSQVVMDHRRAGLYDLRIDLLQPVIGRLTGSAADGGAVKADSLHLAVLVRKHFDFQHGRYAELILRKACLEPSPSVFRKLPLRGEGSDVGLVDVYGSLQFHAVLAVFQSGKYLFGPVIAGVLSVPVVVGGRRNGMVFRKMDDELEPFGDGYLVAVEEGSRQRVEVPSAFSAAVDPRPVAFAESVLHEVLRPAVGTGADPDRIDVTYLLGRRLRMLGVVPRGKGGHAELLQAGT